MSLLSANSFRQFGARDDRPSEERSPLPRPKSEHYGNAPFLQQQMRLRDLIPRRKSVLGTFLLGIGATIAALEAAFAWMLDRADAGGHPIQALNPAAQGSLGRWFSILLMLSAAGASLIVYSIRRHRTDDYQGRYRIWLWTAAGAFLLATNLAVDLREAFCDVSIAWVGAPLVGDGALAWTVLCAMAMATLGSRLLVEVGSSRLSSGFLLCAAVLYVLGVAGQWGWQPAWSERQNALFLSSAEMFSCAALLAATMIYARHVVLDAEGLLPRRSEPIVADAHRWTQIDSPHGVPQPMAQRAAPPPVIAPLAPVQRKLTKAEKKALKERLLRERMQRQRKSA